MLRRALLLRKKLLMMFHFEIWNVAITRDWDLTAQTVWWYCVFAHLEWLDGTLGSTSSELFPCTHPLRSSTRLSRPQVPFFKSSVWPDRESNPTYRLQRRALNELCRLVRNSTSWITYCRSKFLRKQNEVSVKGAYQRNVLSTCHNMFTLTRETTLRISGKWSCSLAVTFGPAAVLCQEADLPNFWVC